MSGGFDNAAPGNLNQTEEYNGSTWSEQNNMGTARYRTAATGTQTATILFGGVTYPGSPQDVDNVEEYDGTSWTTLTSLPSDRGMGHALDHDKCNRNRRKNRTSRCFKYCISMGWNILHFFSSFIHCKI